MPSKVDVEVRTKVTKVTLTFEADSLYCSFIRELSKVESPSIAAFYKMLLVADDRAEQSDSAGSNILRGRALIRDIR